MLCIQSTAVWKHPLTDLPNFEEEESMQGAYDVLFDKEEYQCVTVEVRIVMLSHQCFTINRAANRGVLSCYLITASQSIEQLTVAYCHAISSMLHNQCHESRCYLIDVSLAC